MTAEAVHLHDPQTLYRHWEDAQWNPFAIELTADCEQWPRMIGEDRGLVHWALSSLMVAEERITTKFAGLVLAHGSEEEATFATQQVDEARHMQFYARFQDEVIADPAAIADHVARAREQLSPLSRPSSTRASSMPTTGSWPTPATRPPRSRSSPPTTS